MNLRIKKLEDLDKLNFKKKHENHKKPILIDEYNTIRRNELQRVLNLIMKMDVPILDMVAKMASIGSVALLIFIASKVMAL